MSPEQLRGERVSLSADLYAAGVVLWELLTGRQLHHGESEAAIIVSVLSGDAPSLAGLPGVSDALADVVAHALRRDPLRRFGSARLMRDALDATCAPASHAEVSAWLQAKAHASIALRASSAARAEAAARMDSAAPVEGVASVQAVPGEVAARAEVAPPGEARAEVAPPGEARAEAPPGEARAEVARPVMPAWRQGGGGTALGETGLRTDSVPPVAASDSVARRAAPVVPRRPAQLRTIVTAAVVGSLLVLLAMVATGRRRQAVGSTNVEGTAPALGASTPPAPNALETDEGSIVPDRIGDQPGVAIAPRQPAPVATRVLGGTLPPQPPHAHRSDPATPRTSSSPPKANKCDPPFALDQGGRRIYKRECL